MYTNGVPCADCARAIIQVGIKEIIVDKWWDSRNAKKWEESALMSLEMFNGCGVSVRYYEGTFVDIVKYKRGEIYSLCNKKAT